MTLHNKNVFEAKGPIFIEDDGGDWFVLYNGQIGIDPSNYKKEVAMTIDNNPELKQAVEEGVRSLSEFFGTHFDQVAFDEAFRKVQSGPAPLFKANPIKPGRTFEELMDWVEESTDELTGFQTVLPDYEKGIFVSDTDDEPEPEPTPDREIIRDFAEARRLVERAEKVQRNLPKLPVKDLLDGLALHLTEEAAFNAFDITQLSDFLKSVEIRVTFSNETAVDFVTFYEIVRKKHSLLEGYSAVGDAIQEWLDLNG